LNFIPRGGENEDMTVQKLRKSAGFTLIELLIVIAILGVLAVVVLVAINPVEQLAKTRDAGRISTVTQLGHSLQAYYTARNANYPSEGFWGTNLTDSGELSTFPAGVTYSAYSIVACDDTDTATLPTGVNAIPTYCYDEDASSNDYGVIVYSSMESNTQNSKCGTGDTAAAIFSTADGRGGIVCTGVAAGLVAQLDPLGPAGFTYVE